MMLRAHMLCYCLHTQSSLSHDVEDPPSDMLAERQRLWLCRYNVAGAVLWTVLFVGAGYFFGNLPFVQVRSAACIACPAALGLLCLGHTAQAACPDHSWHALAVMLRVLGLSRACMGCAAQLHPGRSRHCPGQRAAHRFRGCVCTPRSGRSGRQLQPAFRCISVAGEQRENRVDSYACPKIERSCMSCVSALRSASSA